MGRGSALTSDAVGEACSPDEVEAIWLSSRPAAASPRDDPEAVRDVATRAPGGLLPSPPPPAPPA